MTGEKTPHGTKTPRDRFVERLTDVVLQLRLKEIHRQLKGLEEEAAKANKLMPGITLSSADISRSTFRELPREFKHHLGKCIQFACDMVPASTASAAVKAALKDPSFVQKSTQRDEFAKYLQQRPHLQARVSSITYYSPSKWLLEQEMISRGTPGQPVDPNAPHIPPNWPEERGDVYDYAARQSMLGLCFSGGGVRSATFNLGILQALAELDLLKHFDYLSSVSGGGYIHQWLAAWVKRSSDLEHVRKQLIPQPEENCMPASAEPIRWLRRYASYLTPRRGLFSADLWVIVAVWFRNTLLNQIVLFTVLGMVFAIPHFLVGGFKPGRVARISAHPIPQVPSYPWLQHWLHSHLQPPVELVFHPPFHHWLFVGNILACLMFVWVSIRIAINFHRMRRDTGTEDEPRLLTNAGVRGQLIIPLLTSAVWVAYWLQTVPAAQHQFATRVVIACLFSFLNVLVAFAGGSLDCLRARMSHSAAARTPALRKLALFFSSILICDASVVSAAAATAMVPLVHNGAVWFFSHPHIIPSQATQVISQIADWRLHLVLLPPLYLGAPYLGVILLSGFLGSDYPEACREWLARFRAWNLLFAGLWLLFVGVALLGPYVGSWLFYKGPRTAILTFVAAHITTLVSGGSAKSDGKPSPQNFFGLKPLDVVAWIASPIAILGILIAVSSVIEKIGTVLQRNLGGHTVPAYFSATMLIILGCLVVQATLGLRIDVNIFSMHAFYRNRLARCYLGATNPDRRSDPFTGFDNNGELSASPTAEHAHGHHQQDESEQNRKPLYVRNLLPQNWTPLDPYTPTSRENVRRYEGPFPIFCSTINLTFGQDLAWQERKGASFVFTPLYSGYHVGWTAARAQEHLRFNGYAPTPKYTGERGVALDTAVAVSGAAMNPNQGYNTMPAVAFLMTLFNVRLGWWIWNPRHTLQEERRWRFFPFIRITRPSPVCAMGSLIKELLSTVDDTSQFVLLTDGGHFENMGLYELVRRRCKYIIICDAEEDEKMQFGGIGRAIRTCRIDFGAEIDLDLRPLQLQESTSLSQTHCVVGTIKYPPPSPPEPVTAGAAPVLKPVDPVDYTGIIVYIKSSIVGDEPADLLAYKNTNAAFPQDSTANQWFTESQFESYRRLGHHIGVATFQPATTGQDYTHDTIGSLFDNLLQIWYPPTPEMQAHFSEHTTRAEQLLSELRTRPELLGLAHALFLPCGDPAKAWVAHDDASSAYALQFGNSIIDFMWTVYNNLQLAFPDNQTSPHAIGWIELFRKWCDTPLIRQAWTQFSATYPQEFRLFAKCELHIS